MDCGKCGKYFESKIVIDGRPRNLQRRKYCLECSPFGRHNTAKIHNYSIDCYDDLVKIQKDNRRKSSVIAVTKRRKKVITDAVLHFGGKCEICGYSRCKRALEYHHVYPEDKEFSLSHKGYCYSWSRVIVELNKCTLLCANCHREVEDGITILPEHIINRVNTLCGKP